MRGFLEKGYGCQTDVLPTETLSSQAALGRGDLDVISEICQNSDFYTYRYLASQGFLPGYNFPRLPLMAWVPGGGRKSATSANDHGAMVSRPRFLVGIDGC